jgi:peptide/nickel transport system substrate-binding protein
MKNPREGRLRRLVVVTLLTCFAASCGPNDAIPEAEKREPVPVPKSAISVEGQPGTYGGTLRVAVPDELTTFNPFFALQPSTAEILHQLYAPLVGLNPVTGKVEPQNGLAQSYESAGKKVRIKLREGLNFSDGKPITADDLLYSFKVALDPDIRSPLADMLAVSGRFPEVSKIGDYEVELDFVEPYPAIGYVLSQMSVISAGPDPQRALERGRFEEALGATTDPTTIACSGPFKVGAYTKGKALRLDYNPHYWKVDSQSLRLPYLDHMEYQFGLPAQDAASLLKAGNVHVAFGLDGATWSSLGDSERLVTKDLGVGFGTWELFGNMNISAALDKVKVSWVLNPKFREFLSRIVDRDRIAKEVFGGKATPIYSPVSPANGSWCSSSVKKYPYDYTAALAAFGDSFKVRDRDGKPQVLDVVDRPVKFRLYYPKNATAEKIQAIIVSEMARAGVPVEATAVEPDKLLEQYVIPGRFELVLWNTEGLGPDPISYMPVLMMNGSKHYYLKTDANAASILDFEMTIGRLMRAQQDKPLDAERQKDFDKVQQLWCENNPVTYIVSPNILLAYDKRLGNIQPTTLAPYATWNSEQLYFKR